MSCISIHISSKEGFIIAGEYL